MRKANLTDIGLELWLRQRNSSSIVWTTKDGKEIPIKEMDSQHLANIFNMIRRQNEPTDYEVGDMSPMDYWD